MTRVDEDGDPRIDFSPAGAAEWAVHREELELVSAANPTTTGARPLRVGDRVRVRSGVTPRRGTVYLIFANLLVSTASHILIHINLNYLLEFGLYILFSLSFIHFVVSLCTL